METINSLTSGKCAKFIKQLLVFRDFWSFRLVCKGLWTWMIGLLLFSFKKRKKKVLVPGVFKIFSHWSVLIVGQVF